MVLNNCFKKASQKTVPPAQIIYTHCVLLMKEILKAQLGVRSGVKHDPSCSSSRMLHTSFPTCTAHLFSAHKVQNSLLRACLIQTPRLLRKRITARNNVGPRENHVSDCGSQVFPQNITPYTDLTVVYFWRVGGHKDQAWEILLPLQHRARCSWLCSLTQELYHHMTVQQSIRQDDPN